MAPDDLAFPRVLYRGAPDTLGEGPHVHPESGELVGETKRCESPDQWDVDQQAGWRLTRERPEAEPIAADSGDAAGAKPSRKK